MPKTLHKKKEPSQVRPLFSRTSVSITEGPTPDKIRKRAYEIYQARGGESGYEREDWLQAERELYERYRATQQALSTIAEQQIHHA